MIVSVSHGYYRPGQRFPAVVIGQTPAYSGRVGSNCALSLLVRSKERPTLDEPAETVRNTIRVVGTDVEAVPSSWQDARIGQARFDWQGRRVAIAIWEIPLEPGFLGLLDRLDIGS